MTHGGAGAPVDTAPEAELDLAPLAAAAGARVGVDLVAVPAFQARFEGRAEVLEGVFTGAELAYCRSQRRPWPHLAARFAAKEAALKALGTGLSGDMTWHDVEVTRDEAGAPALRLAGATADRVARQRLGPGPVSLAHAGDQAIAVVLLVPRAGGGRAGGPGTAPDGRSG